MGVIRLSMAIGDYGHTRPLRSGSVSSANVAFDQEDVPNIINAFRRMIRELEFDISEMALSTYLCARAHDKPITAIPVFPVRGFHHGSIVVLEDSGIRAPADLHGRRVGVRGYTVTTGVWVRGILQSQYGVDLSKVTWVLGGDEHVAEYKAPSNVVPSERGSDLQATLRAGRIAAAIGVPAAPDQGIVELIPDADAAAEAWTRSEGIYPINHTLVVRNEHLANNPWLAGELFSLLSESKREFLARLDSGADLTGDELRTARMRPIVGEDPLPYGIRANRVTLERFIGFTVDQHIIPHPVHPEDIFAPSTVNLEG